MPPRDKVLCISFAVCAAFLLGDHLAFTANFQPNMILPLIIGKLAAGIIAMLLAVWIAVPKALELEKEDRESGVIAPDEYTTVGGLGAGERETADDPDEGLQRTNR
jgi:ethanolamine transporter